VQCYIAQHLAEDISQLEIAARLGMRPPAFSKFFRAATGRTFTGLVKLWRMNEACRLLATTDARITDIALDCGYRHTSHFDQHFQELKRMSPSTYRRSVRSLAAIDQVA
jgi:transcriptional regulator GlxA family with amidase domain